MNKLQEIPTDKLLDEVFARYDECVFMGEVNMTKQDGTYKWRFQSPDHSAGVFLGVKIVNKIHNDAIKKGILDG